MSLRFSSLWLLMFCSICSCVVMANAAFTNIVQIGMPAIANTRICFIVGFLAF